MKAQRNNIQPFLNREGRILQLPRRRGCRYAVLGYLAEKFEPGQSFTEGQVNAICNQWHTFGDYFVLRRELVDSGFLQREPDGSRYWRAAAVPGTSVETDP
ncbi:MAG: DUF2087 domain-containing protein [Clostridia bacterium]|nr:DUF2087 domain-containing protein [Clostridia bacterium]